MMKSQKLTKKTVCIKYGTLSVKELNQTSQQKTVCLLFIYYLIKI